MNSLLTDYLTEVELAKRLGIGLRTLRTWRTQGVSPPITKLGRRLFFKIQSVEAWLDSREQRMPRDRLPRDRRRTSAAE
jgi:hypothetical protein